MGRTCKTRYRSIYKMFMHGVEKFFETKTEDVVVGEMLSNVY